METLVKLEILNELFTFYSVLLTEKQVETFKLYYENDYTLAEVADELKVSRNAIYDQLKKVEKYLFDYEKKLKLKELSAKRKELLQDYETTKDIKYLELLRKMDE